MFRSLKYRNPKIRDHLAQQYAMGSLSLRVKRRTEAFMHHDPDFEKEVIHWQNRLEGLNELANPQAAPAYVKQNLMAAIKPNTNSSESMPNTITSWWNSIRLWQGLGMASMALLLVLTVAPITTNVEPPTTASVQKGGQLSYLAVMQTPNNRDEAPLVISAYSKTESSPSRIELRWNDRTEKPQLQEATLWAIERDTGKVTQLTSISGDNNEIALNSGQWQAVKSSLELVIVSGSDFNGSVLMRGLCIQLKDWEKA